ncbi:HNH endonuclease [Sporosarcina luteola]|uniref:HNH endonuclease n=1 Tax=Sporosarcina luteola TaxID=582850 RepID=UPI00204104F5|nr:HNH endonuclease signature motif containing protein [Sporosarcina luteola]MCM3711484.1 HNH endonuclease [Sporosarcina luteola]
MIEKKFESYNEQIVNYWFSIVDESDLSVDASEAQERCWRCGCEARLERCHIVPKSLGGTNSPENLVLLCKRCHNENPNITDPEIMWDWIRAYSTTFYDIFWALQGEKEYQFIYGKKFEDELRERDITDPKMIESLLKEAFQNTTFHFGQPSTNTATLAGILRTVIKQYDKSL